jgi:transposase
LLLAPAMILRTPTDLFRSVKNCLFYILLVALFEHAEPTKVDGVRERIEQTSVSLCYLPPYSPEFNPIEKCWAQVKQRLRTLKARSVVALQNVLPEALATLQSSRTANYFRHCGYGL